MVKSHALLALLALTALLGAVGIAPRREAGPGPASPAPSSGVGPRGGAAPRAALGSVGIAPRVGDPPAPRRSFHHFFDGHVHWYGYPYGPSFHWLRPWGGFWWTWDARFSRWVYWHDGFWWWPGPGGVQYVYVRDAYYPYDAMRRAGFAAPPAAPGDRGAWTSPDGSRLIEVTGPDAQAVLYDKTTESPAYLRFLGKGVKKIRFSAATPSLPRTIAVEFADGSAALFDDSGRRLDAAKPVPAPKAPPPAEVPPAPSEELPPPPGDLPPPR